MSLEAIEALLRERIGLDAASLGSKAISRAVENRRVACRLATINAYWQHLRRSSQELEELTEQVVVPETWFFRDQEPFRLLSLQVHSQQLLRSTSTILRVLSIPCSTGEEPYSIAMTLLDAGLSAKTFCIDAVDISHKALAKAERAIYSKRSFRNKEHPAKQRYFEETAAGYELKEPVRKAVNFIHGNLLNPWFLGQQQYDVIFCRNLLIYFSAEARSQALRTLNRLLQPKGLLFVGSAETGQMAHEPLDPVRHPFAFAYRKQVSPARAGTALAVAARLSRSRNPSLQKSPRNSPKLPSPQTATSKRSKPGRTIAGSSAQQPKTFQPLPQPSKPQLTADPNQTLPESFAKQKTYPPPSPRSERQQRIVPHASTKTVPSPHPPPAQDRSSPTSLLDKAQILADSGQLEAAVVACQTYLDSDRTNVQAHTLLGAIYLGLGQNELAEKALRRAIYLDPKHTEALLHLSLLKERRGDLASAVLLRQRLQRLAGA